MLSGTNTEGLTLEQRGNKRHSHILWDAEGKLRERLTWSVRDKRYFISSHSKGRIGDIQTKTKCSLFLRGWQEKTLLVCALFV